MGNTINTENNIETLNAIQNYEMINIENYPILNETFSSLNV